MDPAVGLLIYAVITIASAVLWHRYLAYYLFATLGATATTAALFLFVDYLQSGHWTKNIELALLLTAIPALGVSLLVGLPFRARRNDRKDGG
jgi:hypothetical protein